MHYSIGLENVPKYEPGPLLLTWINYNPTFHPTFYWACDYLSTLWLKLIRVSKIGPLKFCANLKNCKELLWIISNNIIDDKLVYLKGMHGKGNEFGF